MVRIKNPMIHLLMFIMFQCQMKNYLRRKERRSEISMRRR